MIKENNIENDFIKKLTDLKYIYRSDIRDKKSLEFNFREKFKALNKVNLSDYEFAQLLEQITSPNVFKASKLLRQTNSFEREDGTPLHYTLVNIKDWCKNTFEVINQLRINTNNSNHRYDVILLINGLPLVQIELKNIHISPKLAIQQIIEYKNDDGNGYTHSLLCFMQLFIVSNRVNTLYFANNNNKHFSFDTDERFLPIYQYADKNNKKIINLDDFADAFLHKCKLSEMINRYMVLVQSEQKLMMMRPYQIYAVEAIVKCIEDNRGNGYIWHTTGSGKTLTSFKASTLLKDNDDIKKVLFVVDRKDLDRQTREEFNKFQENCVEENTNTYTLVEKLLSSDYADKVIVTTIQKLGLALDSTNKNDYKQQLKPLANERIVFIFDECHRSQFGKNHNAIKEFFPVSQLFGFTGTPIFTKNAINVVIKNEEASLKTTKDIFEKELHNYTITHAIEDKNVLPFHIDHFQPSDPNTSKQADNITNIAEKIIQIHDKSTSDKKFNAILATQSINNAIEYYQNFKKIEHNLNIACVFSPPAEGDKDIAQLQEDLPTELEDNKRKPKEKQKALKDIMRDYNNLFGTNHSINNFDDYYQDIQTRIKNQKYSNADLAHNQKIDIVIVVDMLLTGFDSKFLNTMYVDKNLKYHALIQAFSRTNRVLNNTKNTTKPCGNILDFCSQQDEIDAAITLFSGENNAKLPREIWLVDSASKVIQRLEDSIKKRKQFMDSHGLENKPDQLANLKGNKAKAEYINIFKDEQRAITQLNQYTDLTPDQEKFIEQIAPEDTHREFKSMYLELAKELQEKRDKSKNADDVLQQLDFEFVLFASTFVDYDYIMTLIGKYIQKPEESKMNKEQLISLLKSSANMMSEQEDMIAYIDSLEINKPLKEADIRQGYEIFKANKNTAQLNDIAKNHNLMINSLTKFVNKIISRHIFDGEYLTDLFAPLKLGWKVRGAKETAFMQELSPLLIKMANGKKISGLDVYDE
jgi:type I restriction enzyme R subunit